MSEDDSRNGHPDCNLLRDLQARTIWQSCPQVSHPQKLHEITVPCCFNLSFGVIRHIVIDIQYTLPLISDPQASFRTQVSHKLLHEAISDCPWMCRHPHLTSEHPLMTPPIM